MVKLIVKEASIPDWAGRLINQMNTSVLPPLQDDANLTWGGDVSGSTYFMGKGNVTANLTLATVNANVGTYGNATNVAQITLNGKGLGTAVGNVPISLPISLTWGGDLIGNGTFNAPGNLSANLTLNVVNSNVGTFGNATNVAQVTVNAKGLATAAANVPITLPLLPQSTVGNLPSASASKGAQYLVTDGNLTTFYSPIGGSAGNIVPVFSDGTLWRVG